MMIFSSPIEQAFYDAWLKHTEDDAANFDLVPQYPIGRYRVDFAHLRTRTAIELVGQATHSSPKAIAYDCKREREIEAKGWRVVRFGGREIFTDVETCVNEALALLEKRLNWKQASVPKTRRYKAGERVVHPRFGAGDVLHAGLSLAGVQFQDGEHLVELEDLRLVEAQA